MREVVANSFSRDRYSQIRWNTKAQDGTSTRTVLSLAVGFSRLVN